MPAATEECSVCKFFEPDPRRPGWGLCRRLPPVRIGRSHDTKSLKPEVPETNWCGEFTKK